MLTEGEDVQAGDVVLKLTLRTLEEAEAFSGFLARFLETACEALDRFVGPANPPFVMLSREPWEGADLHTVTFQEPGLAAAFAQGWDRARGGARALSTL